MDFSKSFLNRSSETHIAIHTALMHILVMSARTYTKNYTPEVKNINFKSDENMCFYVKA
jgi:hypothetical protein